MFHQMFAGLLPTFRTVPSNRMPSHIRHVSQLPSSIWIITAAPFSSSQHNTAQQLHAVSNGHVDQPPCLPTVSLHHRVSHKRRWHPSPPWSSCSCPAVGLPPAEANTQRRAPDRRLRIAAFAAHLVQRSIRSPPSAIASRVSHAGILLVLRLLDSRPRSCTYVAASLDSTLAHSSSTCLPHRRRCSRGRIHSSVQSPTKRSRHTSRP